MTPHYPPLISLKRISTLTVWAFIWLFAVSAHAQQSPAGQPPELTPKTPPLTTPPSPLFERLLQKPAETDAGKTTITPKLLGVIIVGAKDQIQPSGVPAVTGCQVRGIPLLSGPDFPPVVQPYLNEPLTIQGVRDLQRDIILYCRFKNRPLVDVILPEQTVENGVIQLWFLEGKAGAVTVQTTGQKWFRDQLILDEVRLRPGDPIDSQQLLDDLNRVNHNPFRQVDAQFKQGAQIGQSDVILQAQEALPLRLYTGYENSGTKLTGEDRVLAGFNWGNAFGLDHQLNYQFMADPDLDFVKAHSASYLIPLPWHHDLTFFGSYVDARADLSAASNAFNQFAQHGMSYQMSTRYDVPLPSPNEYYHHDFALGFDFKVSDNNLLFGGDTVTKSSPDVAQFVATYNALRRDPYGQTSLGVEGYYSPGDIDQDNTTKMLDRLRPSVNADYFYARVSAERVARLPRDFSWDLKLTGQFATDRLPPSEMFGVGGYDTVRGYEERTANGDDGWIMSNELRTPPTSLLWFLPRHPAAPPPPAAGETPATAAPGGKPPASQYPDQLQFLCFWDYGTTHLLKPKAGEDPNVQLSSVGVGFRYVISPWFTVRFDYGLQLDPDPVTATSSEHSRADIAVLLSY